MKLILLPLIYFTFLLFSGIVMDAALATGVGSFLYPWLKIAHRSIFFYGILLNIFPVLLIFLNRNEGMPKKFYQTFWAYQGAVLSGILAVFLGNLQSLKYFEFEWIFDIFLGGYFIWLLWKMALEAPIEKSQREVWGLFVLFPFLLLIVYFFIMNSFRPLGPLSSSGNFSPYFLNVLEGGFEYFLYIFLLPVIVFGVIFMVGLGLNPRENMIRPIRVQWVLHLVTSSISLYFYLEFLEKREFGPWQEVAMMSAYVPFFAGLVNLSYINLEIEKKSMKKIFFRFALLFQIYIWGQIIGQFHGFRQLFMFTDWFTAQKHLIATGLVFGGFCILVYTEEIIDKFLHSRWANVLFYSVIIFIISHWVLGAAQAGVWNKETPYRFLDYPSWISVENALLVFRWLNLVIDIFFITMLIFYLKTRFYPKNNTQS